MSRWMLVGLLLITQLGWSARLERGPVRVPARGLDIANPQDENVVLRNGTIAFNFTNYGWWGNDGPNQTGSLYDPCGDEWAPQFEYPEGSGIQYSFQGALWIGADIEGQSGFTTRVSLGTDGWQNPSINEFHAGEAPNHGIVLRSNIPGTTDCLGHDIYDPSARANLEAIAVYTDTLTDDFWVGDDPMDGSHVPLGLEVTQTALLWTSPEYARFAIWEFDVRNIGPNYLKNLSLGFYLDSDVGSASEQTHYVDDLSGSLVLDPLLHNYLAWSADDDGRPYNDPSGPIVYSAAIGAAALTTEAQYGDLVHSFNWWSPNGSVALDYGPAWSDDPQWDCDYGSAQGDGHKAHVLANRERDYDQTDFQNPAAYTDSIYACASDMLTHEWCPVDLTFEQTDTRFLLSWHNVGQFDYVHGNGTCVYRLNPGEEFSFAVAVVIGDNFHEEGNPEFNFEGLLESYSRAKSLYDQNYTFQPPTHVLYLRATHAAGGALPLVWEAPAVGGNAGYRVYGRPDSGDGERVEFTTALITDESFTVTGLTNGDYWQVEVVTFDAAGHQSAPATKIMRVGAIPNPVVLHGRVVGGADSLWWGGVTDPTFTHFKLVRTDSVEVTELDNLTATHYVDHAIVSGRVYTYALHLENSLGISSLPSNSVVLTPYAPTASILVYDETKPRTGGDFAQGAVSDTLVREWYQQLLGSLGETFSYQDMATSGEPLSLETLAQHEIVIWHSENPRSIYSSAQDMREREVTLSQYVEIGGKLIRFGRKSLASAGLIPGINDFPLSYASNLEPLTLDSAWASVGFSSTWQNDTKTVGATSVDSDYPSFTWDMTKVGELRYLSQSDYDFLMEVDFFWRNGNTWGLYNVNMHESDTSGFDDATCAVIGPGEIFYGFPLYFLPLEQAEQLLDVSLEALRTQSLDVPITPAPLPQSVALAQNYPNPFNPSTVIEFALPQALDVTLKLYNVRGQLVSTLTDGRLSAGPHRVTLNAVGLSSGVYFYRLTAGQESLTRKMLLLR